MQQGSVLSLLVVVVCYKLSWLSGRAVMMVMVVVNLLDDRAIQVTRGQVVVRGSPLWCVLGSRQRTRGVEISSDGICGSRGQVDVQSSSA